MLPALSRSPTHPPGEISLEGLYRTHAAEVIRWATWLGRPRVDPDDVVQEVFLIVRRRLPEFAGDAFRPWLFRITANVVANHRRGGWLRRIWPGIAPTAERSVPQDQWPDAPLESRERLAELHDMLDALPEPQRRALILFELEEMTGEEIAVLLGVPAATVRVWLHRGRATLVRRVKRLIEEESP